jgi:hypothetical protein
MVMDLQKAKRAMVVAWALSALGLVWRLSAGGLKLFGEAHLIGFWLLPSALFLPELGLIIILTVLVAYHNRVASILLLALFVIDRMFTFIWLYIFPTTFILMWSGVTLVLGFFLVQGIRGTFAYHRLTKASVPSGPSMDKVD